MGRTCFCPCCKTGYRSDTKKRMNKGEKVPSLFHAPRDPEVFREWQRAICRADKVLGSKDYVCSLHFKEEDFDNYYQEIMPDGTLWQLKKEKPTLRKGAVPSIFPNAPKYISEFSKKRKPHVLRNYAKENYLPTVQNLLDAEIDETNVEVDDPEADNNTDILLFSINFQSDANSNDISSENIPPVHEDLEQEIEDSNDDVPPKYEDVKKEICSSIKYPWTWSEGENFTSFLFWIEGTLKKWIVFYSDFNVKVYMSGIENCLGNISIQSVQEMSSLFRKVENAIICNGINEKQKTCKGFLEGHFMSRRTRLCKNCQFEEMLPVNSSQHSKRHRPLISAEKKN